MFAGRRLGSFIKPWFFWIMLLFRILFDPAWHRVDRSLWRLRAVLDLLDRRSGVIQGVWDFGRRRIKGFSRIYSGGVSGLGKGCKAYIYWGCLKYLENGNMIISLSRARKSDFSFGFLVFVIILQDQNIGF